MECRLLAKALFVFALPLAARACHLEEPSGRHVEHCRRVTRHDRRASNPGTFAGMLAKLITGRLALPSEAVGSRSISQQDRLTCFVAFVSLKGVLRCSSPTSNTKISKKAKKLAERRDVVTSRSPFTTASKEDVNYTLQMQIEELFIGTSGTACLLQEASEEHRESSF